MAKLKIVKAKLSSRKTPSYVKPYLVFLNDDVYGDQFETYEEAKTEAMKMAKSEGKTYCIYSLVSYCERSEVREFAVGVDGKPIPRTA